MGPENQRIDDGREPKLRQGSEKTCLIGPKAQLWLEVSAWRGTSDCRELDWTETKAIWRGLGSCKVVYR
jgi:hypothetical protein